MSRIPLNPLGGNSSLGDYLREQRQSARLSLRQLSELAGVSNPYLSQIERGLKKPSAEILQQLAKGLEVSAESLYVRAGILDERQGHETATPDTRTVIGADPLLTSRQKAALVDIYDSFVGAGPEAGNKRPSTKTSSKNPSQQRRST
jgi:transcriptional regulator with XRE-family HTH domain